MTRGDRCLLLFVCLPGRSVGQSSQFLRFFSRGPLAIRQMYSVPHASREGGTVDGDAKVQCGWATDGPQKTVNGAINVRNRVRRWFGLGKKTN